VSACDRDPCCVTRPHATDARSGGAARLLDGDREWYKNSQPHRRIRECVENGEITVPYVNTTDNEADFFTKPLEGKLSFQVGSWSGTGVVSK